LIIKSPPPQSSRGDKLALKAAESRIKELEQQLAVKDEEVVILKKAKRLFLPQSKKNTRS